MTNAVRRTSDLVVTAGLGLLACRYFTGHIIFGISGIAVLAIAALLEMPALKMMVRKHQLVIAVFCLIVAIALINAESTSFRSLYYVGVGGMLMLVGYVLSRSDRAVQVAGSLLALFYVLLLASAPVKGILPDDFNNYFPNSSRNGISANLIFLQIFYSAAYYSKYRRAPSITPFITFGLCVLLYGRSGTLLSAGIVAVTALQNFSTRPIRSSLSALVTAGIMIVLIFFPYLPAYFASSEAAAVEEVLESAGVTAGDVASSTELGTVVDRPSISEFRLGLQSVRTQMLSEYAENLSMVDILIGRPLPDVPIISQYNGNPHNSFVRGHSYFGAPYLVLIIGLLASSIIAATNQQQLFIPALMALFTSRAFFDAFALFDVFDVGFFYCYFLLTRYAKTRDDQRWAESVRVAR